MTNYACDICHTRTSYEKTRCEPCALAFKKGYEQAKKDIINILEQDKNNI